jgi:hypothetical protein
VKKAWFFIALVFVAFSLNAQKSGDRDWEIGVNSGISWYNGDLNPTKFFGSDYYHQAIGVSLRKNLNRRFALRGQFIYGRLSANDQASKSSFQLNRNLNFSTPIYELSSTIEFNFLEYDPLIRKYQFSPYSFIGLSIFRFNPETEIEGSVYELQPLATEGKSYSLVSVSIPFGFGFKWAISDRLLFSADWGMRRSFTDYLDDVSQSYPLKGELTGLSENISDRSLEQSGPDGTNWGTQRGNSQTKDWYSFVMAGLSFRIGPKKGSCKHIGI